MFRFVVEHRLYLTLIDVSQTGNHHGEVLVVDNVDVVLEGELFGFEREPVERDDHSNRQAGHWKQKGEAGKAGQTRRLTTAVAGQAAAKNLAISESSFRGQLLKLESSLLLLLTPRRKRDAVPQKQFPISYRCHEWLLSSNMPGHFSSALDNNYVRCILWLVMACQGPERIVHRAHLLLVLFSTNSKEIV